MKLKEIHRTSTFAWSPSPSSPLPLLATGTVAGALDESFSNESKLEIWAPDFLSKDEFDLGFDGAFGPKAYVTDTARFNRLAWGHVDGTTRPRGVIAAGLENGEMVLWDPAKILAGAGAADSLILRNTTHTGPVRGLDFNPLQTSLLASGGVGGEVYIWDLKDPSKPYTPTPGQRSTKLDEITSVAWNQQVQYVLAGASSTGYTVVWDLRGKREVVALAYGGGAGTLAGSASSGTGVGMAVGGRRGMSDIAWHPDNATRVVTASEDDSSPIIMVWDLRNARAPEKILTGHEKGVLSLSWCKQDADLLLSCGKDNRTLCWNPQTSEVIGELPSAGNWAFQVEWCPRNPDMLATAFFDGTIGIHSIQTTNAREPSSFDLSLDSQTVPRVNGADIFDLPGSSHPSTQGLLNAGSLSLNQPPKWLRRPISSSFAFGGALVSVSNLSSVQGKPQSNVVHLRKVVTESGVVNRAIKLLEAVGGGNNDKENVTDEECKEAVKKFVELKIEEKVNDSEAVSTEGWKALLSLFRANSRNELVALLGFSKEEVAARVMEAVEGIKTANATAALNRSPYDNDSTLLDKPHESVVSFAEPEILDLEMSASISEGDVADYRSNNNVFFPSSLEKTPSEVSAGITSDTASAAARQEDEESATTAPSLFGDDAPGTPHHDFFNTVGVAEDDGESHHMHVPHTNYGLDSSVAATIGSGPSSISSSSGSNIGFDGNMNSIRNANKKGFRIYPPAKASDALDVERLVTKAVVLGDFESAVALCLSVDRFADAILLAVRGGPSLLQRTQKVYFERQTSTALPAPYLRLLQSIVSNDLGDIVKNADLREWKEIFVVICTFAAENEFAGLAETLGQRLESEFRKMAQNGPDPDSEKDNGYYNFRKNATLTFLASGRLERLIDVWADELTEEENTLARASVGKGSPDSYFSAHAHALQTFIEKVTAFRAATNYKDEALAISGAGKEEDYKLSELYDRYFEYAALLCSQGLVKESLQFVHLTPAHYKGKILGMDLDAERKRLVEALSAGPIDSTMAPTLPAIPITTSASIPTSTSTNLGYGVHQQPAAQQHQTSAYQSYQLSSVTRNQNQYVPDQGQQQPHPSYGPTNATPSFSYNQNALTQPPHLRAQQQPSTLPPRAGDGPPSNVRAPPPSKRENGGWNDAPAVVPLPPRAPAALNLNKPPAITAPFPNATPSPGFSPQGSPYISQTSASLPPPPPARPGSVNRGGVAATPQIVRMQPGGGPPSSGTGPGRPPSTSGHIAPPPPSRMMSPPQLLPPHRQPTPSQYAPSTQQGGPAPVPNVNTNLYAQVSPQGMYGPGPGGQPQHMSIPQLQHQGPYQRHAPGLRQSSQPPAPPPPPQQANQLGGPPRATSRASSSSAQVTPPKFPIGDRTHIPEYAQPAYVTISDHLNRMRQTMPPNQKRLVDDLERRINPLFDGLNCETISRSVVDQLLVLTRAMDSHDRQAALALHVELLTRGSQTDDIGMWMSGVKQLIMRL